MWHLRDSNPCAFSVKEMFLNGKAHCVRGQKSNTLSTAPRGEADLYVVGIFVSGA